jgi:hypothetical protein
MKVVENISFCYDMRWWCLEENTALFMCVCVCLCVDVCVCSCVCVCVCVMSFTSVVPSIC